MPSKKTLHKTVVKLIANIGPERHHRFPWLFSQAEKWESDESRMNSLVQLALLLLPAAHGAIISQRLAGNWGMMSNVTLPYREHCPLTSIHTLTIDNIWQLLCECRCKLQHLQHNNTLQSKSSARHLLELSIQNEGCQGTPNAAHLFEFKVIKGHHGPPVKLRGGQEQAWSVYCPWLPMHVQIVLLACLDVITGRSVSWRWEYANEWLPVAASSPKRSKITAKLTIDLILQMSMQKYCCKDLQGLIMIYYDSLLWPKFSWEIMLL